MRYSCILRLLLLVFCLTARALAQSTNATISGQVVDPTGHVVPDADIQILNEATGVQYVSKTNSAGIYTVSILPPGQYRVQLSRMGFKTLIKPGIVLNVQSAVALNFTLPLGATSESITVNDGSSVLNTTDASVGTVIDKTFVANIPLNGRSFQDLISMAPGVVTQSPQSQSTLGFNGDFSVNGQRTESNQYSVDGVSGNVGAGNGYGQAQNGTGGALGGSTALGTTQSLVSVDALREFRAQTSTYSAEYGRSPGGQFSLATRSGTNDVHGSLFDYLRNNFFDANDWFNDHYGKPTPALRQNDFGGTVGGPVWIPGIYDGHNQTFFFVSYEGLRLTQPTAAAIQYVPDNYLRQQAPSALKPILAAYPVPNGIDYGSALSPSLAQFIAPFSLPSSVDSTSVRIDHTFSPKLVVFFRYGNTPSDTSSRPDFAKQTLQSKTRTYTLGIASQLSSHLTNDFRIGYSQSDVTIHGVVDDFGGATPIDLAAAVGAGGIAAPYPVISLVFNGIGSSGFAVPDSGNLTRPWNIVDTFDISLGHHDLKLGADYLRIRSPLRPNDAEIFSYFGSGRSILNNHPDTAEVIRFNSSTPVFNDTALFIQDEWHLSSRLSASLGLRWEVNPPPTNAKGGSAYTLRGNLGDPSSLLLAPQGTPLWATTWHNFAPRFGLAWTAHDHEGWETVLRGGGGVFYDTLNRVGSLGYGGLGFIGYNVYSNASLPYTPQQLNFPLSVEPPYTGASIYAFPAHLQLPYTLEWNTSLQQALGKLQTITISYVGAAGRRLIGKQEHSLAAINKNFSYVFYFPGGVTSSYDALELQFQRSVSHGLHALASYTWSHSIDTGSTDSALPLLRGNSDFDVRNTFQGGLSWDLPRTAQLGVLGAILNGWGADGRLILRDGFPIPLQGSAYADPATGSIRYLGLNSVPNEPLYLYGSQYPGKRVINRAAFSLPKTGLAGNAPRNFVRGFGASQINVAIRRDFAIHEGFSLQFRAETFNLLNHPNFGYIDPTYGDATFGQATQMLNQSLGTVASQYQQGGPRSMQFALKLHF